MRSQSRSRESRVSRLSQALPIKRTSRIRRIARMPLGTRRTRGQRSTLIKWIARVSLSSRKTRVQRSSRHPRTPRTPRTGKATATADGLRGRRASAAPRASSTSSLSLPTQPAISSHLRQRHMHHTSLVTALPDLAHMHHPSSQSAQLHLLISSHVQAVRKCRRSVGVSPLRWSLCNTDSRDDLHRQAHQRRAGCSVPARGRRRTSRSSTTPPAVSCRDAGDGAGAEALGLRGEVTDTDFAAVLSGTASDARVRISASTGGRRRSSPSTSRCPHPRT